MLNRLLPDPVSPLVRAEQIRLIYDQGSIIQLLGIATGVVAVAMFWPVASHSLLLLWFGIHLALTLVRLQLIRAFVAKKPETPRALKKWAAMFVTGVFFSGMVWGSLCLFYDDSWSAPYQVILFAIYTGIIAGSFNTYVPYFVAFPAFYFPPVTWLTVTLMQQKEQGFFALAALFLIYTVLMYISALKFHNRLAQSLAIRYENERLANELSQSNRQLTALAATDELTKLANRRSMFKCLAREWSRHYRSQMPLSLMYVDLDYFKQYNDTYGHDNGDKCLVRIAELLHNHALRSTDMAARFGGEEFALILPETSEASATSIAVSIIEDLATLHIPHAGSKTSDRITVSIGIATTIPAQPHNDGELRVAADRALYKAKQSGRNRYVVAPPAPLPQTGT